MSNYTPDEEELASAYADSMSTRAMESHDSAQADAKRGIAKIKADVRAEFVLTRANIRKIKADALRVSAIGVTTQVNNAEAAEADKARDPGPYYHGARYGMRKTAQWLHRRADRIEGASDE